MTSNKQIEIPIDSQKIACSLLLFVSILTIINSVVLVFYFKFDDSSVFGLVKWFDFDLEYNIPSFYSSLSLFFCAFLLFVIGISSKKTDTPNAYWFLLSAIFVFLSFDEALKIHEHIGDIVGYFVNAEGFISFPWVIPYGIGVTFFVIICVPFLLSLPGKIMRGIVASGGIYVLGAIGVEMFGAREASLNGLNSVKYCVLYTIEEFFEMTGIILFMYVLLRYIETRVEYVRLLGMKKIHFFPTNRGVKHP